MYVLADRAEMAISLLWRDLPSDLLLKIATSCPGIQNQLRGVCKTWKSALEANSTQPTIIDSALPPNLGVRFTALTKLDLQGCRPVVTLHGLIALQSLPSLSSLAVKFPAGELTREMLGALQGLPLAVLVLEVGPGDVTNSRMGALRALNLARLDLEIKDTGDFCDVHLQRLAGKAFVNISIRVRKGCSVALLNLSWG